MMGFTRRRSASLVSQSDRLIIAFSERDPPLLLQDSSDGEAGVALSCRLS
jgi:hypothetical protein